MNQIDKIGEGTLNSDDLTRRQWILRLGELVALAGISGVVPELTAAISAQQSISTVLPPGLYEPSQEHLVHALSSGGKTWTPPSGSETDYALPVSGPYTAQFFSAEEFAVATQFVKILLGTIDPAAISQAVQWFDLYLFSTAGVRKATQNLDPLHRILAVEFFGEDAVRDVETADPQAVARSGLRALHELSRQNYDHDFLQLTEAQQTELIASAGKSRIESDLRKLYDLGRTEAIRGYFTTAQGLKELDYRGNAYYGDSPGCEPKA